MNSRIRNWIIMIFVTVAAAEIFLISEGKSLINAVTLDNYGIASGVLGPFKIGTIIAMGLAYVAYLIWRGKLI